MIVRTLNEFSYTLSDTQSTRTVAVSSNTVHLLQQLLGSCNCIRFVAKSFNGLLLFQKWWIFQQTRHLSEKGDWLLVKLLWIANVCKDNLVKRQVFTLSLCNLRAIYLCTLRNQTAHGILSLLDMWIDSIESENFGHDD
jgi:hypothetical protein